MDCDELNELNAWAREIGYGQQWAGDDEEPLPEGRGRLGELVDFFVWDTAPPKVARLPESIRLLRNLKKLDLRDAPLEGLPESIGELRRLEDLYLSKARIARLPDGFAKLKKLEYLEIEESGLERLPEDFGELENLAYLSLTANRIQRLPDSMRRLKRLKRLRLGGNQLAEVPEWIGELVGLRELIVGNNPPLARLPDVLADMPNLRHLAADAELSPPKLAYIRDMFDRPLGLLQATFAEMLTPIDTDFVLPEEDARLRRRGSIGPDDGPYFYGETVEYLFGRGEKGEYVDFHLAHCIWGNRHRRIWENGECEKLETVSIAHSGDELKRICDMLDAKGFSYAL
ncbi:MAG: leucine-rich repeat domain-containing protein [Candidatus Adiutrix sp.]|jgi:hypothetical protein|nr:leucine-rich repeat domain-containing protein [Candidatus Adiutrix sp.]